MPSSSVSLNSPPTHALYDMELPATSHPSLYHVPYDSPVAASPHLVGTVRPKRKQVKNACSACQRACKRCDVGRPCERCIKYGMADTCRDSQRKERKKGVKRGPYKKRDGESSMLEPSGEADVCPGMLNDLQRMASPKRMSRVSSISDIDLSSANLIPIDQPVMPLQQSTSYYQSMPAQTPPQSFASMHSPSHATFHQSEEYYTRYDHLQQANARPQYPSTSQDYRQDRSPMRLQYPSPDNSPGRERQYSGPAYADNSSHRHMIQSVHHDVSYQSQSDGHEYETSAVRNVEQYYPQHQQQSHQGQQHQAQPQHQVQAQLQQHQVQHQVQHQAQHQPQHQVHQAQHQRSYSDGHMADVHQEQYYSGYNSYSQSSSYDNSYYPQQSQHQHQSQHQSQQHQQHQQSYQHHTGEQNDAYMNRMVPDHYSSAPSINSYPTHHQMNGTIPMQYSSVRTQGKMVHRDDMVAQHQYHQSHHASNVQIQSN